MIDDQDLGFIVNSLGIFIFGLVIAYHYVAADPKYEATWVNVSLDYVRLYSLYLFQTEKRITTVYA